MTTTDLIVALAILGAAFLLTATVTGPRNRVVSAAFWTGLTLMLGAVIAAVVVVALRGGGA